MSALSVGNRYMLANLRGGLGLLVASVERWSVRNVKESMFPYVSLKYGAWLKRKRES